MRQCHLHPATGLLGSSPRSFMCRQGQHNDPSSRWNHSPRQSGGGNVRTLSHGCCRYRLQRSPVDRHLKTSGQPTAFRCLESYATLHAGFSLNGKPGRLRSSTCAWFSSVHKASLPYSATRVGSTRSLRHNCLHGNNNVIIYLHPRQTSPPHSVICGSPLRSPPREDAVPIPC